MAHLHSFLHDHRTDKKASHISMIFPKGKFLLKEEDMKTFWDLYSAYDQSKGIGEMPNSPLLPVMVDVDLKKEITNNHQFLENRVLYTLEHVKILVGIYQKILSEILADLEDKHLVCFLLEKKAYIVKNRDKTYLKNGFHLHFPHIFMNKTIHENELLPRVRLELKKLKGTDLPDVPKPEDCVDKNYIKNAWLLYGSQKENNEPYLVTCALDPQTRVVEDWQNVFENYDLFNTNAEKIPIDVIDIDRFLPQIFSVHLNHREAYVYDIKNDLPPVANKAPKSEGVVPKKKIVYTESSEDVNNLVDQLLGALADERAEDHNEWMRIGWILFNIYGGSPEGYEKWLEFSRRSQKFEETVCNYEWNKMSKKDLTIGSLKYIAKEDNPQLYGKIMADYTLPIFEKCIKLDGTHTDIANVLHQKYESEYVCASLERKTWFEFKNHIWKRVDSGYSLSKKISTELVAEYELIGRDAAMKSMSADSEEDSSREKKRFDSIKKLVRNLKSSPYKANVMKEAAEVFYYDDFLSKLDTNPYLIAFANGVYDIKNHVFRDGQPTDFISIKMNISYRDHYTANSKELTELHHFFEKIFPDTDVREYFLDSVADIFIGGNFNKTFQFWTGEGDNGKSITQMIFEQMLGPYNIKLPTALITGKRTQSSQACPELVRAGSGVRLAMLQEPDKKDCMNIGILKELTGNDTFFARGLYKEGQEITPMFKLILVCNEPPKLPHSDKATWNRIKLIPFESTFTNDAPDTFEEQLLQKRFPKDEQFKDKIPKMLEPLAWFLLQRLKNKPKMKKEPLKVTMATANYKKKNDIFKQFIDESIEEKEGKFCSAFELYSSFREWQKASCPNHPCPDKNELVEYFTKLWGPTDTRGGWKNKHLCGPVDMN